MSDKKEHCNLSLEQLRRINHDIGNPLNRISTAISYFSRFFENNMIESVDEYMNSIMQDVNHIKNIIRSTEVLVENEPLNRSDIDLLVIAKHHFYAMKSNYNSNDYQINFVTSEKSIKANAESGLMDMVFSNLIGNSFKYRRHDQDTVIEFGITESNRGKAYFIRDNGKGFDSSHCDQIFGFEYRTPDAQSSSVFGTGQGLYTVKRIIKAHGGSVWAESGIDKGTTIFFTL